MKVYCEDCIWVKMELTDEAISAKCVCPGNKTGPYVTRKGNEEFCIISNCFGRCRHYESEFRPRLSVWHRLFSYLYRRKEEIKFGSVTVRKGK